MNNVEIIEILKEMPVEKTSVIDTKNSIEHYTFAAKFEVDTANYLSEKLGYKMLYGCDWRDDHKNTNFLNEISLKLADINNRDFSLSEENNENAVILQPFHLETPDILVIKDNNLIPIECKTATPFGKCNNKATPRFSSPPREGFLYACYNKKTYNLEIIPGSDFSHPLFDPNFLKIYKDYLDVVEVVRKYLKNTTYTFKGKNMKYRMKNDVEFMLSIGIV